MGYLNCPLDFMRIKNKTWVLPLLAELLSAFWQTVPTVRMQWHFHQKSLSLTIMVYEALKWNPLFRVSRVSQISLTFKATAWTGRNSDLKSNPGTSLVVQWLRLRASDAGGRGSIPGPVTKISQALWCGHTLTKPSQGQKPHGLRNPPGRYEHSALHPGGQSQNPRWACFAGQSTKHTDSEHVTQRTSKTPNRMERSWRIPGLLLQVPHGLARSKYKQSDSLNTQLITVITGGNNQQIVKKHAVKSGSHEKAGPGRNNAR